MPRNPNARKCTAKSKQTGKQCQLYAAPGALVCRRHGAAAPQVAAAAVVRAEVQRWGLGDTTVDPGETLLRLLTQACQRAEHYAGHIGTQVDALGLSEALTGESFVVNQNTGRLQKVGEYIRAMAVLEGQERDRAAKFAQMAIAAGLAERQVRLAERQGALIEQVLTAVFTDLGLTDAQRALAPAAIRKALSSVA